MVSDKATLITPHTQEVPVGEGASLGDVLGNAGQQVDFDQQLVTVDGENAYPDTPVGSGSEIIVHPKESTFL